MGKWKYRKEEPRHVRGLCVKCREAYQMKKERDVYRPLCRACHFEEYPKAKALRKRLRGEYAYRVRRPYRVHVKECCEVCGFEPEHPCQLDVDHVDGNHENNEEGNLQTLCANCHRLKTYLNRDWE